jgi:hypothetical protein
MGIGGIKQPERDTDKLSEMKLREDIAPHCQMISRYVPQLSLYIHSIYGSFLALKRSEDKNKQKREGTHDGEVR